MRGYPAATVGTVQRWLAAGILGLTSAWILSACAGTRPSSSSATAASSERSYEDTSDTGAVKCQNPDLGGPSIVSSVDYAARYGRGAIFYSQLFTTEDTPLEECSLENALYRLASLRCADGNNPFGGSASAAHESRRGSVGPGGRCGRIIDVYDVACPEADYEVFVDMYFCSKLSAGLF